MKRLMIPLTIVVYLMALSVILLATTETKVFVHSFWILAIISIVLMLGNVAYAICGKYDAEKVYKETLIFKIILIPFYIFNFIVGLLVGFTSVLTLLSIWFIFASIPLLIITFLMIVYTYILMLSTGLYNIVKIAKCYKNDLLKKENVNRLVILILHFIFVVDVVGAFVIYQADKDEKKKINKEGVINEG